MNKTSYLIPYWILNFTIGFGWFSLAPIVPDLISNFSTSSAAVLELISLYGYAMVIVAIASGFLSARYSVSSSLISAAVISTVGLFLRAFAPDYAFLFVAQAIAAIAYPLAIGPVGTIAQSLNKKSSHAIVGVSVGILFLGMSAGSFLTPYIYSGLGSVHNVLLFDAFISIVALVTVPFAVRKFPKDYAARSLRGAFSALVSVFKLGIIKNWYVGLTISSFSVMFGGIAAEELLAHPSIAASAIQYAGLLSGLAFLGSALGAIILPPIFEKLGSVRIGMVLTAAVSFIAVTMLAYFLSFTVEISLLSISYFSFGFFGNAFWSMAMTSTTRYVKDPAQAGFATSMYSIATNLGVSFIPVYLGPYFIGNAVSGIVIVSGAIAVGFVLSFFLRVKSSSTNTVSPDALPE